ncbi:Uncharacterised protein [uncultured archaeon]|nr:Uncharacterised protein [uncultured archaeon]
MVKVSEIKTGIDRFLDLINASGETKVDVAASKLGVPAETIEIWAEILQQDNVIEIGYDGFGKMTVRPKPLVVPGTAQEKNSVSVSKKDSTASGSSLLKKIKDKSAWKKRREIKTRSIYRKRLKSPFVGDKKASGENVFSRILKRLGVKK